MRLQVFIGFMVCSAVAMVVFSYLTGASIGVIVLRAVAVLVVLQVVYFILLVLMSRLSAPRPTSSEPNNAAEIEPRIETQEQ